VQAADGLLINVNTVLGKINIQIKRKKIKPPAFSRFDLTLTIRVLNLTPSLMSAMDSSVSMVKLTGFFLHGDDCFLQFRVQVAD
jgi:hypothetical protein